MPRQKLTLMFILSLLIMSGVVIGLALIEERKNRERGRGREEEATLREIQIVAYNRGFKDGLNATLKQMPAGTEIQLIDILKEMECFGESK